MCFTFQSMDEQSACSILAWRYESPYSFYNADSQNTERDVTMLLDPTNSYYSIRDEKDRLVAYCCFGPDARVPGGDYRMDALDVGGGLRPDLTGQGLGLTVLQAIHDHARRTFQPPLLRETIAAWNRRALRVCERAGFVEVQRFKKEDGNAFVILLRPV